MGEKMVHWIWILVVLFVGVFVGMFVVSVCAAGKIGDLKLYNRKFRDERDRYKRLYENLLKIDQ